MLASMWGVEEVARILIDAGANLEDISNVSERSGCLCVVWCVLFL